MVGRNITYFPISFPRQGKVKDILLSEGKLRYFIKVFLFSDGW
jgi:hypothetical protein